MRRVLCALIFVLFISMATSANILSDALDTNLIITTGGDSDWFVQSEDSFSDGDAARSGGISHDQESWMQTTVSGAGTLSFYWKVFSEAGYDFLEFYIDGELQDRISGQMELHQMTYIIYTIGLHTLEWRYVKDFNISYGDDRGWVDQLEWTGGIGPPSGFLSGPLDTNLSFTTDGEANWFAQIDTTFFDGDAAQSGIIFDGQESQLSTTISGSGTLSFYWKVSSEAGYDFLEFYIDGVLQDSISGEQDWHQMVYTITGSLLHTLDWRYVKDGSISSGSDSGWLDLVEWSGVSGIQPPVAGPLSQALDTSLTLKTDGDAEWFLQTGVVLYDGDAAQSGAILHGQESSIHATINGEGMLRFYWKVSSEDGYDFLEFYIDGVLQDRISGTWDWHQMVYRISGSGLHMLDWRYVKDESISSGYDCGWIDLLMWSGGTKSPSDGLLSEALDSNLNFSTGGDGEWFSQTNISYFDGDAAQSGAILDNQESLMYATVSGGGTLSFYWKVSSERDYDFLEFYINGMLQDRISGSTNWQQMMYTITGQDLHTLEWRYVKDYNVSEGDDCGWVDLVEWPSGDWGDWWIEIR